MSDLAALARRLGLDTHERRAPKSEAKPKASAKPRTKHVHHHHHHHHGAKKGAAKKHHAKHAKKKGAARKKHRQHVRWPSVNGRSLHGFALTHWLKKHGRVKAELIRPKADK